MITNSPAGRWAAALAEWAIPDEILAQATESPWGFPTEVFVAAAQRQLVGPPTPTHRRVIEALSAGGSVLDVGSGAGAASLPAAPPATRIVAVDTDPRMLDELAALGRDRVAVALVDGGWPDVADEIAPCDVVVCANVFYNVADIAPFVRALHAKARRRVVVELTAQHPQARLSPLWEQFWGVRRPVAPTADDAHDVVADVTGQQPTVDRWTRNNDERPESVPWIRRRLCLTDERDDEVTAALAALPATTEMVTLSWPGAAG
jgi:SAM-dependent methyltransferase